MSILVCGDVMLDLYWSGDVSRISQEAPVPVVKIEKTEVRAGAASNVARNCKAMGANVAVSGIVGSDADAQSIQNILFNDLIEFSLTRDYTINTIRKLRVIGKNQQIVRVDFEESPCHESVVEFGEKAVDLMKSFDIILFSDYGKGALDQISSLIKEAKLVGKTVLVDPKGHDYEKYRGADLVKPNIHEMKELVGGWSSEEELSLKAMRLISDGGIGAVLLTRGADGMTLYQASGTTHIMATAKEVYDVSGAGDTGIAAFAVALTRGYNFIEAAHFANKASGIVVGKFGTAVANMEEVFG